MMAKSTLVATGQQLQRILSQACFILGAIYGLFMQLSVPGYNSMLGVLIPSSDNSDLSQSSSSSWGHYAIALSVTWALLAFSVLLLLRTLVHAAIQLHFCSYHYDGNRKKSRRKHDDDDDKHTSNYDDDRIENLLVLVEHRFSAGALIAFSITWAGSDFFMGVPLQSTHSIIVFKMLVAIWCLTTPTTTAIPPTTSASSKNNTQQQQLKQPLLPGQQSASSYHDDNDDDEEDRQKRDVYRMALVV